MIATVNTPPNQPGKPLRANGRARYLGSLLCMLSPNPFVKSWLHHGNTQSNAFVILMQCGHVHASLTERS